MNEPTGQDGERQRIHVFIHGRVQGVGFRESLRREASFRGVCGWVRNRWDGTVEAVLEGKAAAVRQTIDWCEAGPPAARVVGLEWAVEPADGRDKSFAIKPTA